MHRGCVKGSSAASAAAVALEVASEGEIGGGWLVGRGFSDETEHQFPASGGRLVIFGAKLPEAFMLRPDDHDLEGFAPGHSVKVQVTAADAP